MMHDEYIRAIGAVSDRNTTHDCPDCGHHTLSVTKRDGKVLYHCWRASCGIRGVLELVGREALDTSESVQPEEQVYKGSINFLTPAEVRALSLRFELTTDSIDLWVRKSISLYVLPIYTREKRLRGYVRREPWGGTELMRGSLGVFESEQKSKTYGGYATTKPLQSWYRTENHHGTDTIVLVEDQISAMRVAQDLQVDAVALLGVSLNAEKVADIQADKKDVVIALDADATRTAFEHARVWGRAFQSCRVVILTKDIKDMTLEEIRALPI